jgi:hypothetical protein
MQRERQITRKLSPESEVLGRYANQDRNVPEDSHSYGVACSRALGFDLSEFVENEKIGRIQQTLFNIGHDLPHGRLVKLAPTGAATATRENRIAAARRDVFKHHVASMRILAIAVLDHTHNADMPRTACVNDPSQDFVRIRLFIIDDGGDVRGYLRQHAPVRPRAIEIRRIDAAVPCRQAMMKLRPRSQAAHTTTPW